MKSFRILHADDDPRMRDGVASALDFDSQFVVMSCNCGVETLAAVPGWAPDLIILDVALPDMDGPEVLARLRESPETTKIPVIFTARTAAADRERLLALGAVAVIGKPFYPVKIAQIVRRHVQSVRLASAGYNFSQRLRKDAATLRAFRDKLAKGADLSFVPDEFESLVHKLAGAAGIFNCHAVSTSAAALEDAIIEWRAGRAAPGLVKATLFALMASIERVGPNQNPGGEKHAGYFEGARPDAENADRG